MEKLDGKTFDVVSDNIKKLEELFPEIVTEGSVDVDKLALLFDKARNEDNEGKKDGEERYEFTWKGKKEAIRMAQKQTTGTLRPCKEESVNFDETQNLYIEGDNLEVLRALQSSYRGKVKMIYIDPPYNTGKDFVYKDNFSDNVKNYKEMMNESYKTNTDASGRLHTNWLNMMYPRLKLAKNLLTDDGVIFISIDEREYTNVKKLSDEVFGEKNYFGDLVWEATTQPINAGSAKFGLQKKTEPILLYGKNKANIPGFVLEEIEGTLSYPHTGKHGACRFEIIEKSDAGDYSRPTMRFQILGQYPREGKRWQIGEATARKLEQDGKIEIVDGIVKKAVYPEDELDKKQYKPFWSLLLSEVVGTAQTGKDELNTLMETPIGFDTVKPTRLIKKLISYLGNDYIALDFFSGTATTAHAVMQLNIEDSGNRKFIMVQIPEETDEKSEAYKAGYKTICEIGKDRIKRAGKKIVEENKDKEGIEDLDIGFKVFKLDTTNIKEWDDTIINTDEIKWNVEGLINPIKDGRSQEDVIYEILLKYGVDLTMAIEEVEIMGSKVYSVGFGYLMICLEKDISLDLIEAIGEQKPNRVVLYDNGLDNESKTNGERILKELGVKDIRTI